MDLTEQLKTLSATAGNPALLALASVDIAHGELPELERAKLKNALSAAATPHWVDEPMLATLLRTTLEDSTQILARLRMLRVIEPFPARGATAVNVHSASRLALRKMLHDDQRTEFVTLSTRSRTAAAGTDGVAQRVEALYHLFAIDQDAAATEWELLEQDVAHPQQRDAVAAAAAELLDAGWLVGAGKAAAILAGSFSKLHHGDATHLEEQAREAIKLATEAQRNRLRAYAHCVLGEAVLAKGKPEEALRDFNTFLQICKEESARDSRWTHEVAVALSRIAEVQELTAAPHDALASMRECLEIIADLAHRHPDNLLWLRELATTHNRIGIILRNEPQQALENFRSALGIYEKLVASDKTNSDWRTELAGTHRNVGYALYQQKSFNDALAALRESLRLYESTAGIDPDNAASLRDIASPNLWIGRALQAQGKWEESLASLLPYRDLHERLATLDPNNPSLLTDLAAARKDLFVSLRQLGREQDSLTELRRAEELLAAAVKLAPTVAQWRTALESVRGLIADDVK